MAIEKLYGTREVCHLLSISRTSLWKLEKAGNFAPAVTITGGKKVYKESDLKAWLHDRGIHPAGNYPAVPRG